MRWKTGVLPKQQDPHLIQGIQLQGFRCSATKQKSVLFPEGKLES